MGGEVLEKQLHSVPAERDDICKHSHTIIGGGGGIRLFVVCFVLQYWQLINPGSNLGDRISFEKPHSIHGDGVC